ncbi:hypothetical protein [Candidatus Lokiarchaeum ossiferum]|uniref:hypothetical protein n=1 Tax=Candidatus Lokiarchaeum ossiferum TaxID=2951803 RepID=UPI00352DBFE2
MPKTNKLLSLLNIIIWPISGIISGIDKILSPINGIFPLIDSISGKINKDFVIVIKSMLLMGFPTILFFIITDGLLLGTLEVNSDFYKIIGTFCSLFIGFLFNAYLTVMKLDFTLNIEKIKSDLTERQQRKEKIEETIKLAALYQDIIKKKKDNLSNWIINIIILSFAILFLTLVLVIIKNKKAREYLYFVGSVVGLVGTQFTILVYILGKVYSIYNKIEDDKKDFKDYMA